MKSYSRSHLSDHTLLSDLATHVSQHRALTAELLADIAEVDARRLYLPAGHPSMYSYCVHQLRLCEQAAFNRIRAARTARQFPAIFPAVAEGRLHLSGVCLLAPYLKAENAEELLEAASGKSKSEIERLIAARFPRPDLPARVQPLSAPLARGQAVDQLSPGRVAQHAPGPVERPTNRPQVAPLAPERYVLQLTMGQEMHDDLRYAQELLGHQLPSGDVTQVLHRALKTLIRHLEKQKFAATDQPRRNLRQSTRSARHIPAHVRRSVWQRDGGQCTFVSDNGRRCTARKFLEFDHVDPVARGGRATVAGMRLRCRAHNQYEAERTFGVDFMGRKRAEARNSAADARGKAAAEEVIPWLRALGFRADEARRAAGRCETIPEASLEQRVRIALSCFGPRTASGIRVAHASAGREP